MMVFAVLLCALIATRSMRETHRETTIAPSQFALVDPIKVTYTIHSPLVGASAVFIGEGFQALVSVSDNRLLLPCVALVQGGFTTLRVLEPSKTSGYFFTEFLFPRIQSRTNLTVEMFMLKAQGVEAGSVSWSTLFNTVTTVASGFDLRAAHSTARLHGMLLGGAPRHLRLEPTSMCSTLINPPALPPRVFYMFMFNAEFELLDLLRRELGPELVDFFVPIEANVTHSGAPKALHFQQSGLGNGTDARLRSVAVLDLPPAGSNDHALRDGTSVADHRREVRQRDEGVFIALRELNARPNDLVLLTDVDGIVSADSLRAARGCAHIFSENNMPAAFHLRHHVYNLNWRMPNGHGTWGAEEGPRLIPAKMLMSDARHSHSVITARGPSALFRSPRREVPFQPFAVFLDAGWHLSWFGYGPERMIAKVRDGMDQELNPFPHFEKAGIPHHRVLKMVSRMIADGRTLWGDQLRWVSNPVAPRSVSCNSTSSMSGSSTQTCSAKAAKWYAPASFEVSNRSMTFTIAQDKLWLSEMLKASTKRHDPTMCYVFGKNGDSCNKNAQKSVTIGSICGSSFDEELSRSCSENVLSTSICDGVRGAVMELCPVEDSEGVAVKRTVFLDDRITQRVIVDGKHFIFRTGWGSTREEEEALWQFCANAGLARAQCVVLGVRTAVISAADVGKEEPLHVWSADNADAVESGAAVNMPIFRSAAEAAGPSGRLAVRLPSRKYGKHVIAPLDREPRALLGGILASSSSSSALTESAIAEYQLLHYVQAALELDQHLRDSGVEMQAVEGKSLTFLNKLRMMRNSVLRPGMETVCEIGFNAGHSSLLWLTGGARRVLSFELGQYTYSTKAVTWLSQRFPGRLQVVMGDSLKTVPSFHAMWPEERCNVLFIDGGHQYHHAWNDLVNFRPMRNKTHHVVLIDDTTAGSEVMKAWIEYQQQDQAVEDEIIFSSYSETFLWDGDVPELRPDITKLVPEWAGALSVGRYLE